ncbi:DUF2510 domain-containing protein [Rathayibacter rathayi]|uniref:DUF2510 domain-containing protein n=1 Tax=Rathayibacter rathayi TaxID=33887 RepID=UPI000BD93D92|nr:DUF2510 domain-containing protein [Rathayibacter rathayi]MWV73319.1 DUF2510 domain-containing protein [Rathayibacter rathayi NCPPB 2980 = VKM Ac-1601]PPG72048.1 DUF2510 domain-containing protein [Rathayibacter rathayi]PPG72443.1 DUF2510 domain-containing protein [Rathayibacter rathayi]PPG78891.1 DUF2510 domain-containing protein [Rathayibacter rathayi]
MDEGAPAGWYRDQSDAAVMRWWDGKRFTEARQSARDEDATRQDAVSVRADGRVLGYLPNASAHRAALDRVVASEAVPVTTARLRVERGEEGLRAQHRRGGETAPGRRARRRALADAVGRCHPDPRPSRRPRPHRRRLCLSPRFPAEGRATLQAAKAVNLPDPWVHGRTVTWVVVGVCTLVGCRAGSSGACGTERGSPDGNIDRIASSALVGLCGVRLSLGAFAPAVGDYDIAPHDPEVEGADP